MSPEEQIPGRGRLEATARWLRVASDHPTDLHRLHRDGITSDEPFDEVDDANYLVGIDFGYGADEPVSGGRRAGGGQQVEGARDGGDDYDDWANDGAYATVVEEVAAGDHTGNDEAHKTPFCGSGCRSIVSRAFAAIKDIAVRAFAPLSRTQTEQTSGGSHDTGVQRHPSDSTPQYMI